MRKGFPLRPFCNSSHHSPPTRFSVESKATLGSPFRRKRRRSERDTGAETPLARLIRPRGSRDETEVCAGNVGRRIGEVRVVGRVQRLCAELELHSLRDCERAEDARVRLEEARPPKGVSAHVPETRAILCDPCAI